MNLKNTIVDSDSFGHFYLTQNEIKFKVFTNDIYLKFLSSQASHTK